MASKIGTAVDRTIWNQPEMTSYTVNGKYSPSKNNITITAGVTQVTATKGGESAPNSIGAGVGGSCGTVTIGGVVYYENNAYVGTGSTYLTQDQIVYPQP